MKSGTTDGNDTQKNGRRAKIISHCIIPLFVLSLTVLCVSFFTLIKVKSAGDDAAMKLLAKRLNFSTIVHTSSMLAVGGLILLYAYYHRKSEKKLEEQLTARTEDVIKKGKALKAIYRALPDGFLRLRHNGRIEDVFSSGTIDLNAPLEEAAGGNLRDYIDPSASEKILDSIKHTAKDNTCTAVEYELRRPDEKSMIEFRFIPYSDDSVLAIVRDITRQKEIEESLRNALKENTVLLKEVHHRVKNNLAVIQGLINLQDDHTHDERVHSILKDVRNRVHSIALVHEKLCYSDSLSRIEFSDYMADLVQTLASAYVNTEIDISLQIPKLFLEPDRMVPIGLIVSELVSNAFKYGFPDGRKGTVAVSLGSNDDFYEMIIENNGVPFPAHIDFRNSEKLGLNLVSILVDQLRGTIRLDKTGGAKFIISFPVE